MQLEENLTQQLTQLARPYFQRLEANAQQVEALFQQIKKNSLLASKRALTAEDVCYLTGFSMSHLYKLTCNNQIPYYKPNGKNLFFDKNEIEEWLLQNRANTEAEAEQAAAKFMAEGGHMVQ